MDLSGQQHTLAEYHGKVVLLDLWGTWCTPCIKAAPELVAAYQRFHDRGLEIIGIASDSRERVVEFIADRGMAWPQTIDTGETGAIHKLYRVKGWPTHYLIDARGTIVSTARDWKSVVEKIEEALQAPR